MSRVAIAGELARALGRLDLVEADHPALRFRDHLLRDDEDVGVLEPARTRRRLRQERNEIVALLDLRDALEREDPDACFPPTPAKPAAPLLAAPSSHAARHGKPVTRTPA